MCCRVIRNQPYLEAGDIVTLPERIRLCVGTVQCEHSAEEPITLTRAIEMAGGLSKTQKKQISVLRQERARDAERDHGGSSATEKRILKIWR